ncbi:MAG: ABC transporter substrate-binding protein [Ectothiorhodospiraceae bacterium]|nr:ABC transporter substrate-binding protein [Ectothiorhodospiraceae bacterium]
MRTPQLANRIGTLILGAAILALATTASHAQNLTRITFVQPSPSAINSYPVFIAAAEGYFAEEGIEVVSEALNGSGAVLQALASGQAQMGRPGPAPLLKARQRGVDVVFLYNSLPRSSFGILVKQDASYQKPDDLKGKVIGVGTADGAEVGFARSILNAYGMSEPADYTFLPVGDGGPATAGFMRGDIEAYVGSLADRAILTYRGLPVRDVTPDRFQTLFGNGYAAMGDYIRQNPKVIEGFGRALVRATKFVRDPANRDKVLAHLKAANPQEGEDPAFAGALLDAVLAKGVPHDPSKGWGYQDPEHWKAWHDNLVSSGEIKPMENLAEAYTNEFIAAWNK